MSVSFRFSPLLRENVSVALKSIVSNRLRSSLTIIIIAIGITSLIGILTAIDAFTKEIENSFEQMGTNSFEISRNYYSTASAERERVINRRELSYYQAREFKDEFDVPATVALYAVISYSATVKYGSESTSPNVMLTAVDEDYIDYSNFSIAQGRNFTESDVESGIYVCIIGSGVAERLFGNASPLEKVVTVSGAGNVAQYTVEKLISLGAKVVTMSDSDGYIYDPDGIDREKLDYIMELKNLYRGRIREYAEKYGVKYVPGARPWGEKCDIAMPSATQNELNGDDARTLLANGCFAVSEGANMPSTPEAIDEFLKAKILYAPGKAANAGGVSVSGLEMTQNAQKLSWSSEEVDQKLKDIMANIHAQCLKYGTQEDGYVNYVKGANVAGFMKVAKAMMAQGIL